MSGAKKEEPSAGFWKKAEKALSRPVRARAGMNISRLSRITEPNQSVVVADKVLGDGKLSHPLSIAAKGFSKSAVAAIKKAGGKIVTIEELKKGNPSGDGLFLLI